MVDRVKIEYLDGGKTVSEVLYGGGWKATQIFKRLRSYGIHPETVKINGTEYREPQRINFSTLKEERKTPPKEENKRDPRLDKRRKCTTCGKTKKADKFPKNVLVTCNDCRYKKWVKACAANKTSKFRHLHNPETNLL
jgi:hypothetical protein